VLPGIGNLVGAIGLPWGLDRATPKGLCARRAGWSGPCIDDAFTIDRVLDTVLALELVRERVIPRDAHEMWEHKAKKRTESGKAGADDTAVELNDGPTGGCNAGPKDVFGLSAFAEAEDAND